MNIKRMRGRNHRTGGGGGNGGGSGGGPIRHHGGGVPLNRNHVFDSNGPDVRVRGTAQQLFEKYLQMGRDATSSGDRVMAEGYFQHAEHYFRIVTAMNLAAAQNQQNNPGPRRPYNGTNDEQTNGNAVENGDEMRGDSRTEASVPGTGEQPDMREIPIAAAPPEG